MKFLSKKVILKYLYDQLTGNFAGFLIGISASSLVSQFFETRSFKNLWGLTSKKTLVNKDTFNNIEWIISIIVGFIVFEIMTKVVKEKIDRYYPRLKFKLFRWAITNKLPRKLQSLKIDLHNERLVIFTGVSGAVKSTFSKYSKR